MAPMVMPTVSPEAVSIGNFLKAGKDFYGIYPQHNGTKLPCFEGTSATCTLRSVIFTGKLNRQRLFRRFLRPARRFRRGFRHFSRRSELVFPRFFSTAGQLPQAVSLLALRLFVKVLGLKWEETELVFVHVPKSGGSTINHALRPFGSFEVRGIFSLFRGVVKYPKGPRIVSIVHLNPDILILAGVVTPNQMDAIESFATVRNTVERLNSAYKHHLKRGIIPSRTTREEYLALICAKSWSPGLRKTVGLSHASPSPYWLAPKRWNGPQHLFNLSDTQKIEDFLGSRLGSAVTLGHKNALPDREFEGESLPLDARLCRKFDPDFLIFASVVSS